MNKGEAKEIQKKDTDRLIKSCVKESRLQTKVVCVKSGLIIGNVRKIECYSINIFVDQFTFFKRLQPKLTVGDIANGLS